MMSCTTERMSATQNTGAKREALKNFSLAMKNVILEKEPEGAKRVNSLEMSDYKKDLLLPAAKELIMSTGVSLKDIEKQTAGDNEKVHQ